MELQGRYDDIQKQGLGLVAISYDSPETLKKFADSRGITFPLISDPGSAIIKRYGILNEQQEPGTRSYGIPHPGTFIVDRTGVVTARFFEEAYQERYTAAAILAAQGADPGGAVRDRAGQSPEHARLDLATFGGAPGERVSIVVLVTPTPTMHVYAPGKHGYQVVRLSIDPQPWLRVARHTLSRIRALPLQAAQRARGGVSEAVPARADLTILATPEMQKSLAGMPSVTIIGALEYQACDDKVCYNPARVPFNLTVAMKPLDRRPPR